MSGTGRSARARSFVQEDAGACLAEDGQARSTLRHLRGRGEPTGSKWRRFPSGAAIAMQDGSARENKRRREQSQQAPKGLGGGKTRLKARSKQKQASECTKACRGKFRSPLQLCGTVSIYAHGRAVVRGGEGGGVRRRGGIGELGTAMSLAPACGVAISTSAPSGEGEAEDGWAAAPGTSTASAGGGPCGGGGGAACAAGAACGPCAGSKGACASAGDGGALPCWMLF